MAAAPAGHDGWDRPDDIEARCADYGMPVEEWGGSWLAYQYVKEVSVGVV